MLNQTTHDKVRDTIAAQSLFTSIASLNPTRIAVGNPVQNKQKSLKMNSAVNSVSKRASHTNVTSMALSSSSAKGYMGISQTNSMSKINSNASSKSSNFFKGAPVPSKNMYMNSSMSRGSKITMSSMFGIGQNKTIANGLGRW